ncbi:META domain-containing protein [Leucobacter tenebrionis]|uniref:META domain-containing protein n=1 Tax=Leucobacter tenebrionis TaxID=2873270 RepID=UPI001CA6771F|nr:META domain-containing protein [Leucobacter tenebrionis]QZY51514.1 META domain-containing protein [Leucobacter tenebrionis]
MRGRTVLAAVAVAAAALLTGCSGASGAAGTWGSDAEGEPQLVLDQDGTLTGTDGCNRLNGDWTEKDETISFGEIASTTMACPDVDTWLSGMSTATRDGSTLHIFDADGAEIGTLQQ